MFPPLIILSYPTHVQLPVSQKIGLSARSLVYYDKEDILNYTSDKKMELNCMQKNRPILIPHPHFDADDTQSQISTGKTFANLFLLMTGGSCPRAFIFFILTQEHVVVIKVCVRNNFRS